MFMLSYITYIVFLHMYGHNWYCSSDTWNSNAGEHNNNSA